MSQIKINRANKLSPNLPTANAEIWDSIPQSLIYSLTSRQLAAVKKALDHHWHKAVAFANKGGEVVDECLWRNGKLIPLAAIDAIQIDKSVEPIPADPNHSNPVFRGSSQLSITKYNLDYLERI